MSKSVVILGCSAILVSPALAADNADIVVTASGIEQSRSEVGQAITVIDAKTIETRQDISVVDLLATTPGVRFSRNGSVGGVTGVSLRGAETTQTLVLVDGVKVNDPSGIGDMYDFGSLLVGNIRRIEVLRGSNSVAHGSQAIGGVVNVITGGVSEGIAANASAEYGYSDTVNLKADVSGGNGRLEGGAGIAYFRTDGISDVDSSLGGTERDGYENIAANVKLKVRFTDAVSLDLRGYYIHGDKDFDSFFGTPSDSPDVAKSDQYIGYAGVNAALFNGLFKNRVAVTYFRHDRDYYFVRSNARPDYGYRGESRRYEYQGVLEPIDAVRLIFGYEHEKPEYRFSGFGSTAHESANTDSVYGLAVVKPVPSLSLTAGMRHDDHSQFGGATTFGANANWALFDGDTHLRLSYGEGFKAPSLFQLYDSFSGNRNLRPERSKSYDAGLDQSLLEGAAQISATYFHRDTRDQINFDNATFVYDNLAHTRAQGFELVMALRPVAAFNVTASYSHIDAKDRSPGATFGNRLPRRAKQAVSLSADCDWSFGLSTGATVTLVGDSYDNLANSRSLDGYVLVGVRARLPISEQLELYGRIDNLFDEQYQTAFRYGTYGRSAYAGIRLKL